MKLLPSFIDIYRVAKNFSCPKCIFLTEVNKVTLCLLVSSDTLKKYLYHSLLSASFLCFFLVISLVKMFFK